MTFTCKGDTIELGMNDCNKWIHFMVVCNEVVSFQRVWTLSNQIITKVELYATLWLMCLFVFFFKSVVTLIFAKLLFFKYQNFTNEKILVASFLSLKASIRFTDFQFWNGGSREALYKCFLFLPDLTNIPRGHKKEMMDTGNTEVEGNKNLPLLFSRDYQPRTYKEAPLK